LGAEKEMVVDIGFTKEPPKPTFPGKITVASVQLLQELRGPESSPQRTLHRATLNNVKPVSTATAASKAIITAEEGLEEENGPLGIPIRFRPKANQYKAPSKRVSSSKVIPACFFGF
jgi:hypothetical protein